MSNPRTYGHPPFGIVVVHGGLDPGREMADVARELQADWGVLEPFQTETSLGGQVNELKAILETSSDLPAILIGYSWEPGSALSFPPNTLPW